MTALHAQGGFDSSVGFFGQRYAARFVLVGAHCSGTEAHYDSVRFQMLGFCYRDPASDTGADAGPAGPWLEVDLDGGGKWLRCELGRVARVEETATAAVPGCVSLAALVTGIQPAIGRTQVREAGSRTWIDVVSASLRQERVWRQSRLLPWDALTVTRLNSWLRISADYDGLEWGVISPPVGPVQVQLLTAATIVEGLHRRTLLGHRKRIALSNKAIARIVHAAKDASETQFAAEGFPSPAEGRRMVGEALAHFDELSFAERTKQIVTVVEAVVPELFGSVPGYADQLVKARNQLAHHLRLPAQESRGIRAIRWAVIARTVPWLLRVYLLLEAGFPREIIRESILASSDFEFHLANTAEMAREVEWQPPSTDR